MSHYFPTVRGWAALLLPLVGGIAFLAMLPVRFIESGVGTWVMEPVRPSVWVFGGVLILLCVAVCM